ncbi:hypothetical protein OA238_118p0160 (plasmid) [Octadecabacter arcticus 238]|uniref:Uncharacterized protein n=1 Tax=Octadecabacter arcticus 238 TaxID=391616 RepID=M9RXS7_9RHOB|nr:hypothetical protein [Octadecabacter arcticus]AGI74710.1 hypothetical protein OA238_118p0160 [Octadecabacter arcticus 238]
MKVLGQIMLVVFGVVLAYLLYAFWPEIRHATRTGGPQHITAEVQLINRCGMPDANFVVLNLKTRRSAPFSNGLARINVMEGDYLELQLSARYSTDVTFNSVQQRASRSMKVTADCGVSERIQGTMDSMRNEFGN